jgi:hypothetical protein
MFLVWSNEFYPKQSQNNICTRTLCVLWHCGELPRPCSVFCFVRSKIAVQQAANISTPRSKQNQVSTAIFSLHSAKHLANKRLSTVPSPRPHHLFALEQALDAFDPIGAQLADATTRLSCDCKPCRFTTASRPSTSHRGAGDVWCVSRVEVTESKKSGSQSDFQP